MGKILLAAGLFGILTSTIFLAMVFVAVRRFFRRPKFPPTFTPPVSLLKPLHGAEPGLKEYLQTFFQLDYPDYEILFCARGGNDPGLGIARELAAANPHIPVRFLASGEPRWPNARCYSLGVMKEAARNEILVITDSDVRVTPNYLRSVVAPLAVEQNGLVTCVYRGVADHGGFWARLEALGMSTEMTSGVIVADMLEGMKFALGPSMAVRKRCVDEIGGFEKLGDYYADDFMLGNLVAAKGHTVVLSGQIIDHCIVNTRFAKSLGHQFNWMRSTRFSRPKGHLGTGLTFSMPFGILTFVAALSLGYTEIGFAALTWCYLCRVIQSALVGGVVVHDKQSILNAWLYPLRDLTGFAAWAASYMSKRVGWRDDVFEFTRGGVVRLVPRMDRHTTPAAPKH